MAHHRKSITAVLLSLLLLLSAVLYSPAVLAAEGDFPSNALVIIGDKTVTYDMTQSDVELLFGAPKITTASLFGGNSCTFYGDNYSDYLYIETNSNGQIVVFGTVSDNFRMRTVSAGELNVHSYYVQNLMNRYNDDRQDEVCGALDKNYRVSAPSNAQLTNAFAADVYTANKNLIPHSVAMFNAATTLFGYQTPLVYDEEVYDYVLQLAENGTNPTQFARSNNLTAYERFTGYGTYGSNNKISLLSPMRFASAGTGYTFPESKNCAAFIYYLNSNDSPYYYCGAVSSELFVNDEHPVALTADEQATLQNVTTRYLDSVSTWNGESSYYAVDPSVSELPIEPGKVSEGKLSGAVGYINAIRAGAGLADLERSNTLTDGAQAKAAYTRYLGHAGYTNNNPHYPPKVDGISDEFYQQCQLGSSENLYWGDVLTGMMKALDDGFGDPVYCGHRRNLLDPYAKQIGLGSVEDQSAQKFTGGQSSNIDFVCWPSKGVTPTGALYTSTPRWTISAYNGYRFNSDTYVTVTLLNNESKSWTFTRNDGDSVFSNTFISFDNNEMTLSAGYVYQVTMHNVVNTSTQAVTDYTYRAVIAEIISSGAQQAPSLMVEDTEINIQEGDSYKLYGVLSPRGNSQYTVTWTSSDPAVAEVSPCGMVRAKSAGTAVITAFCGGNTAQCTVTVSKPPLLGDVDKDGTVDIVDATVLQRYLAEMEVLVEVTPDTADTTCDGHVNVRDVTAIQRYLAQLIDHFG